MKKVLAAVLILFSRSVFAQQAPEQLVAAMIVHGDTFPTMQLPGVEVVTKMQFASWQAEYQFYNLKKNVLIVYPYAQQAGEIFREINIEMNSMDKHHEQKKFLKEKEKELDDLYESDLKNLTVTQGQILCKLISYETGTSVYDLISEFKNPLSAFYWQSMGKFLGYNLKENYDPNEDKDLNIIVHSLEDTY